MMREALRNCPVTRAQLVSWPVRTRREAVSSPALPRPIQRFPTFSSACVNGS
jgi:hypothetical protein